MTYGGSGTVKSFWYADTWASKRCMLVDYDTFFSVYVLEDYKRCVCYYFGASADGSEECPQEASPKKCDWGTVEIKTNQTVSIPT